MFEQTNCSAMQLAQQRKLLFLGNLKQLCIYMFKYIYCTVFLVVTVSPSRKSAIQGERTKSYKFSVLSALEGNLLFLHGST